MKWYGDIELISGEVVNLVAERVSADPTFDAADEGIIIYNTTENSYKYNNGSDWVTFEVSVTSSNALVETLGDNWINPDFSFDPTDFNALDNISGLTTSDSLFNVIEELDAAITGALTVTTLQGVPLDFVPGDLSAGDVVFFDGTNFVPGTINDLGVPDVEFGELSDTTFTSLANNQFAVRAGGAWVNKPIFFRYNELSGTLSTFTVNHSLGAQFCHVTIIDRSFATPRRIDPSEISSIQYNSANTLTVNLTGNKPVTILVTALNLA